MGKNQLYGIGKVEEICNLSKKAIRFYDKMGILSPDKVSDKNGYRYYSKKTLLSVPMIKYYKQSGFKLEEMKALLEGTTYSIFEKSFRNKIDELKELENEISLKIKSIKDWYDLIVEAQTVIENDIKEVSVKYVENCKMIYLDQDFNYDYMDSIINIEFTNYIESINNAITGPVMIHFPSFEDKMNGKCNKMKIMQQTILKCKESETVKFGGFMVASCYHVGSHETISETYKKIKDWAKKNGYKYEDKSYERYVTDYWTTKNIDEFVTEVMVKINKGKK
ncbi:MerR family transcriptional regulator [Clostridium sp. MSJ-11]|uniref:MerR family transcriptional regulator n=1 Tax=Clostridium mobile TaxID=2841512 RepID=A0ABS6EE45_9CLOT|nr:MerR family transcriptional regulator [Clostridium mobile]MBU5483313.1 MerR family transcriptional regulator [Clostridium mobile]